MASIEFENVVKVYPGAKKPVVPNLNLKINDKEFIILVGPSGCGKSTTLRRIAGLEDITSGTLRIDGKKVNDVPARDRDIAMVFQSYALYPNRTVYKNIAFPLKVRKLTEREIAARRELATAIVRRKNRDKQEEEKFLNTVRTSKRYTKEEIDVKVHTVAKILDLEQYLDRKPANLSGGQRQRVALGRALVRKPKIFLFDEPLSGLDAKMKNQMCVELGRLHSRLQATMVLVTHDQNEAMTMGDRVVCLSNGKIQQVGTPMELYEHPANEFVASFIGVPPMNIFAAQWGREGLYFEKAGFTFPVSEAFASKYRTVPRMLVGVRPEFFTISAAGPNTIVAVIEVVEHLGYETLVYAQSNDLSLVVRVPPLANFAVGEKIYLSLDEKNIHLFDISTGASFF